MDGWLATHFADVRTLEWTAKHVSLVYRALFEPFLDLFLKVLQIHLELSFLADVLLDFDLARLDVIVVN